LNNVKYETDAIKKRYNLDSDTCSLYLKNNILKALYTHVTHKMCPHFW